MIPLVTFPLFSCNTEQIVDGPASNEELPIEFTVNIPSVTPGTRSMTTLDENTIVSVDVLAFYNDGSGNYRYGYTAPSVNRSIVGDQLTETVTVKNYTAQQQFVILVNATNELTSAGIILNEVLPNAMRKIVCATGNGEWPARNNGSSDFKAIPMYAKSATMVVVEGMPSPIGPFPLIRMLARIDIRLKDPDVNNFKLTKAMLFNYKTAGYVAYDFSSYTPIPQPAATQAAVPLTGNHSGDPILSPTVFYAASTASDPRGEIIQSIYTYESPAFTIADRLKGTAIVVGGLYNGSLDTTYYRINLKTTDDTDPTHASSHILRNHLYDVVIQSVGGPGAETPIDAYKGITNLVVEILLWNSAGINVDFPQYHLTVSKDHLYFPGAGGSQTFTVTTDYPDGWEIVDLPSWITVSPSSESTSTTGTTLTVTLGQISSITTLNGSFGIKAGNLTKTILVTQETLIASAPRITWEEPSVAYPSGRYVITYDPRDGGLFFKYGSVVGLFSDHGKTKDLTPPATASTDAFHPAEDVPFNITSTNIINWSNVPFTNSLKIDESFHSITNVKAGLGDPCRLVGLNLAYIKATSDLLLTNDDIDNHTWRLPTNQENIDLSGVPVGVNSTTVHWWSENAAGNISYGVAGGEFPSRSNGGIFNFLPPVGQRNYSSGAIEFQCSYGLYRSSDGTGSNSNVLTFWSSGITPNNSGQILYATSVRCVKQESNM